MSLVPIYREAEAPYTYYEHKYALIAMQAWSPPWVLQVDTVRNGRSWQEIQPVGWCTHISPCII